MLAFVVTSRTMLLMLAFSHKASCLVTFLSLPVAPAWGQKVPAHPDIMEWLVWNSLKHHEPLMVRREWGAGQVTSVYLSAVPMTTKLPATLSHYTFFMAGWRGSHTITDQQSCFLFTVVNQTIAHHMQATQDALLPGRFPEAKMTQSVQWWKSNVKPEGWKWKVIWMLR